jgi:hypothetical protein
MPELKREPGPAGKIETRLAKFTVDVLQQGQ